MEGIARLPRQLIGGAAAAGERAAVCCCVALNVDEAGAVRCSSACVAAVVWQAGMPALRTQTHSHTSAHLLPRCHLPGPILSSSYFLLSHTASRCPSLLPPGSEPSVPSTVEAQQNARNTSDLLRRFRELGERMRQVGPGAAGAAGQWHSEGGAPHFSACAWARTGRLAWLARHLATRLPPLAGVPVGRAAGAERGGAAAAGARRNWEGSLHDGIGVLLAAAGCNARSSHPP